MQDRSKSLAVKMREAYLVRPSNKLDLHSSISMHSQICDTV
jgi:hypothetical protein